MNFTWIVDGLHNKIRHDLCERSIVLSASIENVFDDFAQLIHFKNEKITEKKF